MVFRKQFPKEPLCTPAFAAFLMAQNVRRVHGLLNFQLDVAGAPMTARYGIEHPLIPQPDDTFVWTDPCKDVAEAIEHNERVFVHGPSGTGKSTLIRQIAAHDARTDAAAMAAVSTQSTCSAKRIDWKPARISPACSWRWRLALRRAL